MIREFLAHTSPGRSRIFAIDDERQHALETVTTLGTQDLHLTESLLTELNSFLVTRNDDDLETVAQLPSAVQIAVRNFLKQRCSAPATGMVGVYGPLEQIRLAYFSDGSALRDYLDGAYMIGLGVRMTNEVDTDGEIGWEVVLLNEEAFVPAGADPRSWSLPPDVPLLSTWTSHGSRGNPIGSALTVATRASSEGHWVRLHTFEHGSSDDPLQGESTSEVRVDVFDAPIPLGEEE